MKKIKKILMTILVFLGMITGINIVKAETYSGRIKSTDYIYGPYYYMHKKGGSSHYETAQYIVRTSDGERVYCLQPMVTVNENATYQVTTEDIAQVLSMSQDTWKLVSKIAYYGWGYSDATHNHSSDKWYVATQMLIWRQAAPDVDSYFTKTLNGTKDSNILSDEMNEIMSLVNSHLISPSFSNFPTQMRVGESISVTDNNSVLGSFDLADILGGTVTKSGNTLSITATNVGNISFKLKKLGNRYGNQIELYYATDSQNAMHRGNIDPINIPFNVNVIGGKVAIQKVDSKTLTNVPQGTASLKGAIYGVYKEDGTKLTEITTDENGFAKSDYLSVIGRLYIQEIKASPGYKIDNTKYYVELTNDNLEPTVQVKEPVIEGRIKVLKKDSETNACKSQGEATLVGAKYGVYDSKGTLVDTLTIGSDCTATSKLLPYSKYTIRELETSTGYYIDTSVYEANINEEVTLTVTSLEPVVKGRIKVIKYDSQTNTCNALGQAMLSGAKYGIYDKDNKLVDTLVIGNDCSAISKLLPYGNYTIKEIESSVGYNLDPNTYNAKINENVVLNINSKEDIVKARIRIEKVDSETNTCKAQGSASLIGAKYNIYDWTGKVVETLTIGNDCSATSGLLPFGKYTVKETQSPIGYILDANVYTANVTSDVTIPLKSPEPVVKGRIKVIKYDKETNTCKPQGDATLIGAKYGIYDSKNKLVDTLTIGNDCSAISKLLPYDDYTIKEITSSVGYYVDPNTYHAKIDDEVELNITSYEGVVKGKIKIEKIDSETRTCTPQGEAVLVGAKYGIYNSKGALVETLTIGENCTAISGWLPYGRYTVKETESPVGYYMDINTYTANIENDIPIKIISPEPVIKGRIKVIKQDSKTKTCSPLGQATLVGAKYGVYDANGTLVDTLTIGEDCTATSKYLPYYTKYKVKEISPSKGYILDKNVYSASIPEDTVVEITSKEDVTTNYISILKQYDYVDETTQFLNAEEGITFEIYYPDGRLFDTITTDKNGYATIEMPYGVWRFHQVNSHSGYEKIHDFHITVNETSEKKQYYNILNNSINAYLQIVKTDSETGKTIAIKDTTFKIYNMDKNEYVSQYVGGKIYDEFKTDEDGKCITYLKLPAGNYKLIEISSPYGYLLNSDGIEFAIDDDSHLDYTTYGAFITVKYQNTPIKGRIEIRKKGELPQIVDNSIKYEEIPLKKVRFNIYADGDILSSDGNHLYYANGELVDTIETDNEGYAISIQLPLGKYIIKEVKTLDNYFLDLSKHNVELKAEDNKTSIVYRTLSLTNKYNKGELEFTKTDLVSGKAIPNTKIQIFTDKDELFFEGITDDEGKIIIKDLFVGKFYIVETEPATGYRLSDEKVFFEIKENGEIVKANMTNKKKTGTLEFTKLDISTSEPLPNTKIQIFNEEDELIFEGFTNEEGKIILEELEYGRYYIIESEAPEGYELNPEKMYFEILDDGEIVKATMTDDKIPIPVPDTESNEYLIPICITLIGVATGVILYEEHKKRK